MDELTVRKILDIERQVAAGKRKVYTERDFLKRFPHLR